MSETKCYTPQDFELYQAGGLAAEERIRLEEHLLQCDSCMDTYLKVTESYLCQLGETDLSFDFPDRVMAMIEKQQTLPVAVKNNKSNGAKYQEKKNARWNLFIGYCAAACIAMFFWVGGCFDGIAGSLTKEIDIFPASETVEQKAPARKINLIQTGWTKKTLERQQSLFANFKLERE